MKRFAYFALALSFLFSVFTLDVFAASSYNVLDYNDYISNISVDGDSQLITITLPFKDAMVQIQGGHDLSGVEDSFVEYTENGLFLTFSHIFTGTDVNSSYYDIFPLGRNLFSTDDFPDGTVITFNYEVMADQVGIDNDNVLFLEGELYTYVYAWTRDSQYQTVEYNRSSLKSIHDYSFGDMVASNSVTVDTVLNKNPNVSYLQPMIRLAFDNDSSYRTGKFNYSLIIHDISLTFSIDSLLRLSQQNEYQNKILKEILSGSIGDNEKADNFNDSVNDVIDKADSVKDELGQLNKPSVDSIMTNVDPYGIVSPSDFLNYTSILSVFINSPVVTSMLSLCVIFSFLSLVLFGKKG